MGLETASYISELNPVYPLGADSKSQGDDHLRLLKAVLQNTFPEATKPMRFPGSKGLKTASYLIQNPTDDRKTVPIKGGYNATLPVGSVPDGFTVNIVKADHSSSPVVISGNGNLINGEASLTLYQRFQRTQVVWADAFGGWLASTESPAPIGSLLPVLSSAPAGYLLAAGTTIGRGSSLASFASDVAQGLFEVLWNNTSNTVCPVSPSRGASAVSDFNAGKLLYLPDLRGRVLAGLDVMAGSTAGVMPGWSALGQAGGEYQHTLLLTEMPVHKHTLLDPGHQHSFTNGIMSASAAGTDNGVFPHVWHNSATVNTNPATTGITMQDAGAGGAHNNVQPTVGVNLAIKL